MPWARFMGLDGRSPGGTSNSKFFSRTFWGLATVASERCSCETTLGLEKGCAEQVWHVSAKVRGQRRWRITNWKRRGWWQTAGRRWTVMIRAPCWYGRYWDCWRRDFDGRGRWKRLRRHCKWGGGGKEGADSVLGQAGWTAIVRWAEGNRATTVACRNNRTSYIHDYKYWLGKQSKIKAVQSLQLQNANMQTQTQ